MDVNGSKLLIYINGKPIAHCTPISIDHKLLTKESENYKASVSRSKTFTLSGIRMIKPKRRIIKGFTIFASMITALYNKNGCN